MRWGFTIAAFCLKGTIKKIPNCHIPKQVREEEDEELIQKSLRAAHMQKRLKILLQVLLAKNAKLAKANSSRKMTKYCGDDSSPDHTLTCIIIREPHKMPTLETILAKLRGCKIFSTIDFFHIVLDEKSHHITNFYSGEKYYRYKRLPFGLCNAPDIFQKTMEQLLDGCHGVMIYLDDILVYGKTKAEHDANLEAVMQRLNQNNVKLNSDKCKIGVESCIFLGFKIDGNGYHVTEERLQAIREFRLPQNLAEVHSFLGLMNFVDKFIINRADSTQHMQTLVREKKFKWTPEAEREFDFMKNETLTIIETLGFFDQKDPIELFVDASPIGLGAVLVQRDAANKPRIIACASKVLSKCERRYPQTQREALAVVWATERFRFYLLGNEFTIWTDGEANEYLYSDGH